MRPHRVGLIVADVVAPGGSGMNPDGPPAMYPVVVPGALFQQGAHAAEFQVPRRPRPVGAVGFRVVQDVDVVYHHVTGPGDHWPELLPTIPPQRVHRRHGQWTQPVAAGQKIDRIVAVAVQGNAQAVDRIPGRVQADILMHAHLDADGRRLDQNVFPGEHRISDWQQRVHDVPYLPAAQHGDEVWVLAQRVQQPDRHTLTGSDQVLGSRIVVQRPQCRQRQPGRIVRVQYAGQVNIPILFQLALPRGFDHKNS